MMKKWYQQWDDFINEQEEPKLKSSGNVQSHFDQTLANLTAGRRSELSSKLKELFSDSKFKTLFNKHRTNPDSLELTDKDFLSSSAEDFIRSQGLSGELDLPGSDAAIEFLSSLQDKVGSPMSEEDWGAIGDHHPLSNSEFNDFTPNEFALGVTAGRL